MSPYVPGPSQPQPPDRGLGAALPARLTGVMRDYRLCDPASNGHNRLGVATSLGKKGHRRGAPASTDGDLAST
jgi:hypothetical protein